MKITNIDKEVERVRNEEKCGTSDYKKNKTNKVEISPYDVMCIYDDRMDKVCDSSCEKVQCRNYLPF